jgi:hypothetical protein
MEAEQSAMGWLIGAVTVTAGVVTAFWVRTGAIEPRIREWIEEKYMRGEMVKARIASLENRLNSFEQRFEQSQAQQTGYLEQILQGMGQAPRRLPPVPPRRIIEEDRERE